MLYVIDKHTESVENITNKEGSFEQVLFVVESNSGTTSTSSRERERFTNAIMQGIVYNLSIEELATMCCYSVSTFKRRFNQHFNESPHKWLLRCRLMLAAKIMSKTDISITELSSLCGFVNVSHFIATFRRHFGVTPSSLKVRPHEQ
jgi:AraC-like DNA-binding protein